MTQIRSVFPIWLTALESFLMYLITGQEKRLIGFIKILTRKKSPMS